MMPRGRRTGVWAAPAKVNFTFAILGRRPDGYHEIESLMAPVSLCDDVRIAVTSSRSPSVSCRVSGPERVEGGADNLAARAAAAVLEATGVSASVAIRLYKRIPAGAGLGGGSSDAAAVLRALPRLLGRGISTPRLRSLARRLGADVPFFLGCRPAIARGIGEDLEAVHAFPRLHLALVVPPARVATAWAYANVGATRKVRERLTSAGSNRSRGGRLRFDAESINSLVFNDFEPRIARKLGDVRRVTERLAALGAQATVMTGSGSAVVGMFASEVDAKRAAAAFRGRDRSFAVRVLGRRPALGAGTNSSSAA